MAKKASRSERTPLERLRWVEIKTTEGPVVLNPRQIMAIHGSTPACEIWVTGGRLIRASSEHTRDELLELIAGAM